MPEIWSILKDTVSPQILWANTFEIYKGSEYKKIYQTY